MSHDVSLLDEENHLFISNHSLEEGGNYIVGGNNRTELNITYNYTYFFHTELDPKLGLYWLNGKTGKETESTLDLAVKHLGVRKEENYWTPTPGNAGFALSILLEWAKEFPTGVWEVI